MTRVIKACVLTYIIFIALIILVATPAADYLLGKIYQQQTGRTLHYNGVGINPFSLTFYIYKAEDTNASGSTLWAFDEFAINLSLASLFAKGVVLDELSVKSLYLHPQKNKDGHWIFDDILRFREALEQGREPATPATNANALPAITIHKINFDAKYLGYSDFSRPQPFEAGLEKINISLNDFSTLIEEGRPYHLVARDESGGELEWQGTLSVPAQYSKGEIHLRKISLMPVWRFIQSDVNFKLDSAFLDMGGNYEFSWAHPENPEYKIHQGRVAFSNINIRPKQDNDKESGIHLDELAINHITVDSQSMQLHSSRVDVNRFRSTLSILEDGSTNFQSMLASPKKTSPKNTHTEQSNPGKAYPDKTWRVDIDSVHLDHAAFAFNDYSIKPNFKVQIQDFSGDIKPISSLPATVTQVDLKGSVDGYAPVTLAGKVKPSANPVDLQLAFNFKGIELSSFAPYSGTYAGYRISSGLLNVALNYTLHNNKVQGANKIVITRLTLGEKVKSPRLVDLPLRLALALLTDENGVIDLDVDVSGDASNPDFSIGKIVLKALRNIIVKAVTAPFRLLASLVGGGDDFEFIAFDIGQSQLSENSKQSLVKLQSALSKRPQLNVGLAGLYSEDDRRYFKALALHNKFIADGLAQNDIDNQTAKFSRRVNNFYKKFAPDDTSDKTTEQKHNLLVNAEINPQLQLEQLADARAMAAKLYLLQDLKMDAAKVYIDKSVQTEQKHAVKLVANVK